MLFQRNEAMHDELRNRVIAAIRTVFDPEIPVNIYELGLIYGIDISDTGAVNVRMTLTSPNCPVAESLPRNVESKIRALTGVTDAKVQIVWEPPWTPDKISEAGRLELECMGIPDISSIHKKDRFTGLTVGRNRKPAN
jgi:FeS assembly SUF system protein